MAVAAVALALALSSCATTSSVSSADRARGLAAVHRYVLATKHWRPREYRVASTKRERGLLVYEVTFLPDLRPPVAPGGGESFEAYYDPRQDKIVNVLHGQYRSRSIVTTGVG